MKCPTCSAPTVMGRCVDCHKTDCTCRPAPPRPVWLRRAAERRNGLAKDMTEVAA